MRLKRSSLKSYYLKNKENKKDTEGVLTEIFKAPHKIKMQVWPAGGKMQAEIYGQRLSYIRNCLVDGLYSISVNASGQVSYVFDQFSLQEGDGVCMYVDKDATPDYKIISIKPYAHLYIEVENNVSRTV